ncbi:Putrescine proton symporter PotE [Salmonella enterica subsp. enterica serovar Johannesburg str. S5-703]|nr:Putrescine proton symporter PotE [Salmonella enterica subsp. enterica serovar Johannesburg str. S5-703]
MSKPKSNKMGVVQLTILTMVNMMGSGIIMLPTKLSEVGTISIISWLVTAVGSMALAWAFAKCGMFSRKSGGMGGYAEYAFGKSGNFMANYTYGVSLLIANVAIAISAVGYGTELFELFGAALTPHRTVRRRADAAPDRSGDYRRIVGLYHRKLWRRAYYRTDQ